MLPRPTQAHVTLRRGRLYKYKSLKGFSYDHVCEILRDSVIYIPRPSQLNDPMECRPLMAIGDIGDPTYRSKVNAWVRRCVTHRIPPPTEKQIQQELAQLTQQRLEGLIREATALYHHEVDARYRILSLSDSLTNHHLWYEYADNYEGVCLEFFVDPMLGSAYQMIYRDEVPFLDITNNEGFDALILTALVKRLQWQRESEYRLVFGDPPIPGDPPLINQRLQFPPNLLTSVIFGQNIAADRQRNLIALARGRHPKARCLVAFPDVKSASVGLRELEY